MKKLFTSIVFILYSSFLFSQTNLKCITYGSPMGLSQLNEIGYYFNNNPIEYNACQTIPAIIIAVIDTGCTPWNNCDHNFGQANQFIPIASCPGPGTGTCRNRAENYFIFRLNDPAQVDTINAMLSSIPQNYHVLAYTWFTYAYSTIPAFKNAFQNLGATQISTLPDSVPYIFYIKVGQQGTLLEITGTNSSDTLSLNTVIDCTFSASVNESEKNVISIYQDPNGDKLHIINLKSEAQWFILDMTGKLVNTGQVNDSVIYTGKLSKGIYVCTITIDGKKFRKLFVVK